MKGVLVFKTITHAQELRELDPDALAARHAAWLDLATRASALCTEANLTYASEQAWRLSRLPEHTAGLHPRAALERVGHIATTAVAMAAAARLEGSLELATERDALGHYQ